MAVNKNTNYRLYMTNGHTVTINADSDTSNSALVNISGSKAAATNNTIDKVDKTINVFKCMIDKNAELENVNLNILKFDAAPLTTITIDASTFTATLEYLDGTGWTGTGKLGISVGNLGAQIYQGGVININEDLSRENSDLASVIYDPYPDTEDTAINSVIRLNPRVDPDDQFFGKIVLKFKTIHTKASVSTVSPMRTLTVFFIPYTTLTISQFDNTDITQSTMSVAGSGATATNVINYTAQTPTDLKYTYKLSSVSTPIALNYVVSHTLDVDIDTIFDTTSPAGLSTYIKKHFIATFDKPSAPTGANVPTLSIDETAVATANVKKYVAITTRTLALTATHNTATANLTMTFTSTSTGIHSGAFTFPLSSDTGAGFGTIFGFNTIKVNYLLKVSSQLFVGDVGFIPSTGAYDENGIHGVKSSINVNGLPLTTTINVTSIDGEESAIDLSADTFSRSTTVVVYNKTDNSININIRGTDYLSDPMTTNTIYLKPEDDTVTLASNKQMIFLRVLFDPTFWEKSAEFDPV